MNDSIVKPCINENIKINFIDEQITVFNTRSKKSYSIGEAEYNVLIKMDGTNTIKDLSDFSQKYDEEQTERLVRTFEKIGLVEGSNLKAHKGLMKFELGMINGNKIFKTNGIMTNILYFIVIYTSIPLFFGGMYFFFIDTGYFQNLDLERITDMSVIIHLISFMVVATIHEFSHAVVARKYNVSVPEIGVMFYLFIPYVYTNLSFIKLLKSKKKRLLCLCGGILSNVLISGLSFCVAHFTEGRINSVSQEVGFMNIVIIITNLMIFFKLDGYFILEELIEESYLREKSMKIISDKVLNIINRIIKKEDRNMKFKYSLVKPEEEENEVFYTIYGVLSVCYIPVLLISAVLRYL